MILHRDEDRASVDYAPVGPEVKRAVDDAGNRARIRECAARPVASKSAVLGGKRQDVDRIIGVGGKQIGWFVIARGVAVDEAPYVRARVAREKLPLSNPEWLTLLLARGSSDRPRDAG